MSEGELRQIIAQLGFESPQQLMRTGEAIYKELGLKGEMDEKRLMAAMLSHPKLIERPIVTNGKRAILGRPPEAVTALF